MSCFLCHGCVVAGSVCGSGCGVFVLFWFACCVCCCACVCCVCVVVGVVGGLGDGFLSLLFVVLFGEFDPGSGRTLAACLTHASRTGLPGFGWVGEWRTGE